MSYRPKFDCLCPLYIRDTQKRIHCKGVANVDSLKLIFEDEKSKLKYIQKNCTKCNPDGCEIYQLLKKKYEDK